jgi:hypothetical protein
LEPGRNSLSDSVSGTFSSSSSGKKWLTMILTKAAMAKKIRAKIAGLKSSMGMIDRLISPKRKDRKNAIKAIKPHILILNTLSLPAR